MKWSNSISPDPRSIPPHLQCESIILQFEMLSRRRKVKHTSMNDMSQDYPKAFIMKGDEAFEALKTVLHLKSKEDNSNDLFTHLREVLIVGRLLGVIPISGVFKHSSTQLSFRKKSIAAFVSVLITCILTVNLILASIQWVRYPKTNALQIAQSIHRTAQYFWGWIIYIYFLIHADKFLQLFHHWSQVTSLTFYSREDKTLRRDSICICSFILSSCILENAVLHLEYFKEFDHISGGKEKYTNVTLDSQSSLETYYWRSNYQWAFALGYNEFLAVLAFVQHKWMLYTWNYLDIVIAVFARALYFKFKVLYDLATEHLGSSLEARSSLERFGSGNSKVYNKAAWLQVVADHKHIYGLLQEFESFFSHLVFGAYAVNIYYLCIQLLIGLSPEISVTNPVQMIYGPWSFLHMAMRIYIVSLCAARINMHAHQIRRVLEVCPVELYTGEIARIDKRVTSGPQIGLTGLGCFVVTKPFILTIISVIFTFEIVLLQGVSSGPSHCCCATNK